ncbi:MAG: phosphate ABC transporter permease PstA [Rhodovarius sp.]|nr:phosphate ABC transporter permease PstA [Rhodovarius sp.]MCX7931105.1 phosphate ABC transporter permease PstA [Rhodovarius sp.]MDW8313861.1 phosphate ABC transporter permease PstA [Rhodovarius sp.]
MTDAAALTPPAARPAGVPLSPHLSPRIAARRRGRHRAEMRFRLYGLAALSLCALALIVLLASLVWSGLSAFWQTHLRLEVEISTRHVDPTRPQAGDYGGMLRAALEARFPEVTSRADRRRLHALLSSGAEEDLRRMVTADPSLIGTRQRLWLLAGTDVDMAVKTGLSRVAQQIKEGAGVRLSERQLEWLERLSREGDLALRWNSRFFTAGDSRDPERVGVLGGLVGSLLTLLVCLALALPVGVAAAVYLEEFAPRNRFTALIEVNIANLAAVPSIVFGLLGLAVFLNAFGMPRSAPLVGGAVLALLSLPIIIIAARAALRAVPPSVREAALSLGASRMQVVTHHVLPLAMPGILTGTILALANALGETAPLLMIGMVAFIVDIPRDILSPATVLPVQIYMWASGAERGFVEKTAAGIMVLLAFMLSMNAAAILMRRRVERRW